MSEKGFLLYNFLIDSCEYDWRNQNKELICWINFSDLKQFTDIVGYNYFCEGDIKVILLDNCIAFDIIDLLEYIGIEPEILCEKPIEGE